MTAKATRAGVDSAAVLARFARTLAFGDLPPVVVTLTKQCILDVLGTTLASTTLAPESHLFHSYVREIGGTPECTLIGYGEKAPAQMAAFLNGSNSHMMDFDDCGVAHVSVSVCSVAWAIAEKVGRVPGKELLTAVAAGIDIQSRIARYDSTEAWELKQLWSSTQTLGYLSGAAVAGRLLGLTDEQIFNAMGIAYQQVSGVSQRHLGIQAGWSSQGAVIAALLAKKGVPGVKDVLDGKAGLFQAYMQNDRPDNERLTGNLGKRYKTLEIHGFKAWPACGMNRRPITGILSLRKRHRIDPDDVEAIVIHGGEHIFKLASPLDFKRRPTHSAQAKYSLPYTCAVAMVHGNVKLDSYDRAALANPRILAMADRIWAEKDERSERIPDAATVEIRLRTGEVYREEVVHPFGDDRENPMSQIDLEDKFRDCARYSKRPLPDRDRERVIAMVAELENVDDVGAIVALL